MSLTPTPRPPTRGELLLYHVLRGTAVGISRLYLPGRVVGRANLPAEGPYLLAPVHRSYVDWLIVARVTSRRRLRYIAKAEIWKSKFVGRLLEACGAFPVHRSGADREALERCRAVLAGGEPLVMFPEGTRRSGALVTDLREGVAYLALRAGVPVVPVGIGGSERAMPRGSRVPRPRRVEIVIGKALWPSIGSGADAGGGDSRGADAGGGDARGADAGAGDARKANDGAGDVAGRKRPVRVSRRATREFSDQLAAAIQTVFDEAQRLAGVPNP
jgi:1-acyl-sn-glycerol-3-phosphate acyltransferase